MQKWEYRRMQYWAARMVVDGHEYYLEPGNSLDAYFAGMHAEGWELVALMPKGDSTRTVAMMFRRPLDAPAD